MDDNHDEARQEVERRFRQAVEAVPTPAMWTKYLVWLAETSERTDESGGDAQMKARRALKQGYEDAHSLGCLEPELYRQWVRLLMVFFPDSSGSSVANRKRRKVDATAATTECSNDNNDPATFSQSMSRELRQSRTLVRWWLGRCG